MVAPKPVTSVRPVTPVSMDNVWWVCRTLTSACYLWSLKREWEQNEFCFGVRVKLNTHRRMIFYLNLPLTLQSTTSAPGYICICNSGWQGVNCDQNINECTSNPCLNGGTCTDGVNGFTCSCTAQWTGALCQSPQQGMTAHRYDELGTRNTKEHKHPGKWSDESGTGTYCRNTRSRAQEKHKEHRQHWRWQ